jgi:hypothetical protein
MVALAQTRITIIGTAHQKTAKFSSDSILSVLNKIKPDVILLELDTSLMDAQGNYKRRLLKGNEDVATREYKRLNPALVVRRFDIEDRNAYYTRNNTFAMEQKLGHAIDSVYNAGGFDVKSKMIIDTIFALYREDNRMSQMDINSVNLKTTMAMSEKKQYWIYVKEPEVVFNTPSLRQYYDFAKEEGDFWIRRNKRMTENIVNYAKKFNGKNIVVLTGFTHKYILTKYLTPLQNNNKFTLKQFPAN